MTGWNEDNFLEELMPPLGVGPPPIRARKSKHFARLQMVKPART
jgi:hypothetical protein